MIKKNIKSIILNKNIKKSCFSVFFNKSINDISNNDIEQKNKDNVIFDEKLLNEIIYKKENENNIEDYYNKPLYD